MKHKICCNCGYVGKPIPQAKDSYFVDLFAWAIFFSLTAMSQQFYLMLIPIAWTIYHTAKFKSVKCPECENLDMVSIASRKGMRTMEARIRHKPRPA